MRHPESEMTFWKERVFTEDVCSLRVSDIMEDCVRREGMARCVHGQ